MNSKTKRKLRILWCIAVPVAIVGIGYYVYAKIADGSISFTDVLIAWGACIVVNLPMTLAAIFDGVTKNRPLLFLGALLWAPVMLVWNWFDTVKSLIQGRSGVDWLDSGSGSGGGSSSGGGDDRSNPNGNLIDPLDKAIDRVCINSSNYADGSYIRVSRKSVKSLVTKINGGIKIYGDIYYEFKYRGYSDSTYESDLNSALETTKNRLLAAADRAIDEVQDKYRGYDCDWNINVSINGHIM